MSTSPRERRLINAVEEVLTRWAIVRVSAGRFGDAGLVAALAALDIAADAYEPEDMAAEELAP